MLGSKIRKSVSVPPNLRKPGDRAVARARSLELLRRECQEIGNHYIYADCIEGKHGKHFEEHSAVGDLGLLSRLKEFLMAYWDLHSSPLHCTKAKLMAK